MHYYQYDVILQDGNLKHHVSYMFKTPTPLNKGRDIREVLILQENVLRHLVKFDKILSAKLTGLKEDTARKLCQDLNLPMETMAYVELKEDGTGVAT